MAAKVKEKDGFYWVVVHYQGRRKWKKIGKDKRQALRVAEQVQARIALGEFDMHSEEEQAVRFDHFAREWYQQEIRLPYELNEPGALATKSVQAREQQIRLHLVPFFLDRDVRAIRVADIQAFYENCRKTRYPATLSSINTILGTLRRILAFAQARELLALNPVDAWKASRGRQRGGGLRPVDSSKVLTADEVQALLEVARTEFPDHYPLVLFMADTGCRVSEAFALRWSDVDLEAGLATIEASIDFQGKRGPTKTRKPRSVELSTRLREALSQYRPDVFGDDSFAFPSQTGSAMEYQNFRSRVFNRIVRRAFAQGRRVTPHCLRHTFASLHIARGTNLLWIQEAGGWASAKMLLDVYGHFMPTESAGFADAITAPNGTPAAPTAWPRRRSSRRRVANARTRKGKLEPTSGLEPLTCSLRVSCSTS